MPLRMPKIHFTRRIGKVILVVLALALMLCGLAAWQVPRVLRTALTEDASQLLGRPVAVGAIRFNPFTLTLRVQELSVAQPGGAAPLLAVAGIEASASWVSLLWLAPVVDSLVLAEPKIALQRDEATRFNFSDIEQRLNSRLADQAPAEANTGLPRFSLNNMVVRNGSVTLDDRVTGRQHVIDDIELGVPFISTFGYATDIDVQPRVHMRINGSPLDLDGVARPFDKVPSSTLRVVLHGLELDKWVDVWPVSLPVNVQRLLLDSDLEVRFEQPAAAPATIKVLGDVGLRRLDLRDVAGRPLLEFGALNINRLTLEPMARTLYVGEVALWAPQVQLTREAGQPFNWLATIDKFMRMGGAPQRTAAPRAPAAADGKAGPAVAAVPVAVESAAPQPDPAWRVVVDAVNLYDGELAVRDASSHLDYKLAGLAATVEGLRLPTEAERPGRLWLSMDNNADGGWLRATGPLSLQPLTLTMQLDMGNMALTPFAAMLRGMAPVQLQSGRLGLQAQLSLDQSGNQPRFSASGVQATLADFSARDDSVQPAVNLHLDSLRLTADRLALDAQSTAFGVQAAGVQGAGRLDLQGTLAVAPLSLKTRVDIQDLDLASFAPYVAGSLNATVRAVAVNARGDAEFTPGVGGAPVRARWRGAVDVTGLDLEDRVNRDDFLKWGSLRLSDMDVSVAGAKLGAHLGDVTLEDFYGRILLNSAGRLNVMDLVAEPGQAGGSITQDTQTRGRQAAVSPAGRGGAVPDISVASVTLKRGKMTFTDRFVKPNYTAELSSIEGTVSAVSSSQPQPAKVSVAGRVYNSAPLAISGTVQPFVQYLSLDIKASAKGVDLPRFTTYAAKYVGYPITRGKLSLDLHYQIKDRALQASNRVVLNQLSFGDKTNSPDATTLPVMLAVALLKDRNGNIDIDLPISGSLDDPQFSVGGLVVRVFVNLVAKAVTAPFSLLASAFGGDEELAFIEFEPGSAQLSEAGLSRVATLAKALNDRPALKMDLSGRADPRTDIPGLQQAWIEQQLRQAKARATAGRGKKPDATGVQITPSERLEYLKDLYSDTDIKDKPRNLIGLAKTIPAEQMEELLRQAAPGGEEQLRQLADARAQVVYEQLQAQGLADRIFVVAPRLDADDIKDEGKPSRVDFSLR